MNEELKPEESGDPSTGPVGKTLEPLSGPLVPMLGWGDPAASTRFFSKKAGNVGISDDGVGILRVFHGDMECRFDQCPEGNFRFLNYSSQNNGSSGTQALPFLATDLTEEDVILGKGCRRLEALLEEAARRSPRPELIVLRPECTSIIVGDDVGGVVERFQRRHGLAVVIETNEEADLKAFGHCLRQAALSPDFLKAASGGMRVNLIGFPEGLARGELARLLGEMGIGVSECLLPGWSLRALRNLGAATLQVFYPHAEYSGIYRTLLDTIKLPSLFAPSPYGMEGTRRWLEGVRLDGVGDRRSKERLEGLCLKYGPRWMELQKEARNYRLGFVLDGQTIPFLADPSLAGGVPLLPVLAEMGFGIDLLVASPRREDARRRIEETIRVLLRQSPPPGEGDSRFEEIRAHWFERPEDLWRLLKDGDFRAVYSDFLRDRRLVRGGKAQFTLSFFEMGFAGAIRTAERLLALCRLPFPALCARYRGNP